MFKDGNIAKNIICKNTGMVKTVKVTVTLSHATRIQNKGDLPHVQGKTKRMILLENSVVLAIIKGQQFSELFWGKV